MSDQLSGRGASRARVGRGGPLLRVALTVLGVVLTVAIVAVVRLVPDHEQRIGPMVTKGELGSEVDTGGFVLEVSRARVTRKLVSPPDDVVPDPPRRTDGLWVVVEATLTGDWEATTYADARLERPDGTTYAVSERLGSAETLDSDYRTDPGLPRRGLMVFEIPADALTGSVLKVSRTGLGESQRAPEAEIDLGLDESGAARLLRESPDSIPLTPVEFA